MKYIVLLIILAIIYVPISIVLGLSIVGTSMIAGIFIFHLFPSFRKNQWIGYVIGFLTHAMLFSSLIYASYVWDNGLPIILGFVACFFFSIFFFSYVSHYRKKLALRQYLKGESAPIRLPDSKRIKLAVVITAGICMIVLAILFFLMVFRQMHVA